MSNTSIITLDRFIKATNVAEARWYKNRKADVIAKGIEKSDDLIKARKFLDAKVVEYINETLPLTGVSNSDFLVAIEQKMPVKAIMRWAEFMLALSAGSYSDLDGITCSNMIARVHDAFKLREGSRFVGTGKGNEYTSIYVKDQSFVRKLQKFFPTMGDTTESTKFSRSFGVNGFCRYLDLGFTFKNEFQQVDVKVNADNIYYQTVEKMLMNADDVSLSYLKGALKDKKN